MLTSKTPSRSYAGFRASSLNDLLRVTESQLNARVLKAPKAASIDAFANLGELPRSHLWFCSYGSPLVLRFSEGDYVRVQFAHAGTGRTLIGGRATSVTSAQCCISPPDSTIEFGAGFQQLVWRVDRKVLTDKLEAIVGRPITGKLDFQSALASGDAGTGSLSSILHCIVAHLARSVSPSSRLVLEELEQALIVSMLCNVEHNRQYLLAGATPDVAPRQVRRVEEYIDANWANPFRIEDMAAIAGASSRSVYRTFRNTRGYSPKEFLRQRRLLEARALLNDPDSPATVTQVALACGFSDASRFSKDFRKAYGQPPSAVRKGTK